MEVETFEVTEVGIEGKIDNFEECKELVDKLNLKGQKDFLNIDKKEVIPYRKMTAQEQIVYGALCQERTKLPKYGEGPIPLRVLQVASHVKELDFCDKIMVWHKANADVKDPILVGLKGNQYSGEQFMLARWGEALKPFKTLMEDAKKVLVTEMKAKLSAIKVEVMQDEASIEAIVENCIAQGKTVSASYYGVK